jgi:hypothetical protein
MVVCLLRLFNFASTFSIKTFLFMLSHIWVKYYNNVVYIICQYFVFLFTQRLIFGRIPRTFDQMRPCFTSGINIGKTLHVKWSMTREWNPYIQNDHCELYVSQKLISQMPFSWIQRGMQFSFPTVYQYFFQTRWHRV